MESQSFSNHTRWHAPFHFFIVPVLLINFIWSVVDLILAPGWYSGRWVVVSAAVVTLAVLVRINPLRAQDRLIRLEESLRFHRLLPAALAEQACQLNPSQMIALRFASDAEVEGLVNEVIAGRLTRPVEIKKAIKNWRADTFRV